MAGVDAQWQGRFGPSWLLAPCWLLAGLLAVVAGAGCGTTQSQLATQQLLMSDAVDRSVAKIDFSGLRGKKVFLDDRYMQNIKGIGFVNSEYFVSALRQQMFAAGCQLQETVQTAEIIVEGRIGGLGNDGHEVTYGVPPSKTLSSATSVLPNVPDVPVLPEIAFAKRNDQLGAAKVAVFAYDKETRTPLWQSGTSVAMSDAKNTWVLGIGPFQRGTIYKGTLFAGERLKLPLARRDAKPDTENDIAFHRSKEFIPPASMPQVPEIEAGGNVQQAQFQQQMQQQNANQDPAGRQQDNAAAPQTAPPTS
jgi:hypothetical protein